MEEEFECSICRDRLVDHQILPCGHFYCKECKEILLQFEDDGSALLECPKKCSQVTNIQKDQALNNVLQNAFVVENFLDKIRSRLEPNDANCQEGHEYKIPSSRYCQTCRNTSCISCFDEHPCEGNNHINIAFDHQKKSFQPICEQHKTFARHICRKCNDQLICVYCKHRKHKNHDIADLNSHVIDIKRGLTAEYESASKFVSQSIQSNEKVMKRFQEFREKLSEELLVRKVIRVNRYIAQENEEQSKILKQFDDHVNSFNIQRKVKTVADMKNLLDDQNSLHDLVMISEQKILLEKLQDITKQLSLRVVLSDLANDNHLGELQLGLNENENFLSFFTNLKSSCNIIKKNANEMLLSTDLRNAQNFQDEVMKFLQKFTSQDIRAIIKNGKEITNLKLAMALHPKLGNESDFLKVAVKNNQWKMLKVILESKNVDINTKYDYIFPDETTALMIAATTGHSECVKLLLSHNCDIDMKDDSGRTALIYASEHGYSECMKLLLSHNCDIDMKDIFGKTALIYATKCRHSECVKLLLAHNCDIDMKDNSGKTALIYASACRRSEFVKLLLAHNCDINMKDNLERTALIYASGSGHSKCMKLLLAHNCDIDMKCKFGKTALLYASEGGHSECVNILNQYKRYGHLKC